ncbi:MAG: hypothetical protein NC452_21580 [Eubacterium sp.]|nr:hypothetical protein [Eubacterium sp.]
MSIDQATVKTGIAVHCDGELTLHDLIDLDKEKVDIPERIYVMVDRICGYIQRIKPDFVVFEDVAMQSNPSTLILLSRLQGAIIGYCRVNRIPYDILKPPNWRKALGFKQGQGIKRPQLKKQAVEYVKTIYGLSLSEDVCEAVCIGDAFLKIKYSEKRGKNHD